MILLIFSLFFDSSWAQKSIKMGILFIDNNQQYLFPMVVYENEKFYSAYSNGVEFAEDSEREKEMNKMQQFLKNTPTFYLYSNGNLIGYFNVNGINLASVYTGTNGSQFVATGRVLWKNKKPKGEINTMVALSSPVPQPKLTLKEKQLEKAMECQKNLSCLINSFEQWATDNNKKEGDVCKMKNLIPNYIREIPKCPSGGTYQSKGCPPGVFKVGKIPTCSVSPHVIEIGRYGGETFVKDSRIKAIVDINGDGINELIIHKREEWEAWSLNLYQIREGHLVKILDIGGYGL